MTSRQKHSLAVLALVLVTPVTGRQTKRAPAPKSGGLSGNPIRLVTWNVQKCEGGLDRITTELTRLNADVVCLQEVIEPRDSSGTTNQTREIASALGMHPYPWGGKLDDRRNPCLVIMSRAPLSNTEALFSVPERNYAVTAVVEWNRRPLRIVCVHLAGNYKADLKHILATGQARAHDWEELQKRVQEWSQPVIVAGDFNTPGSAPEFKTLGQHLRQVAGTTATFPSGGPWLDLDHVLCSSDLATPSVENVDGRVSDHRPLLVGFTLRAAKERRCPLSCW